jgi:choline dehydrogenase-like flavoprotein
MSQKKYDVCIIGSGAGAGPVAYSLSKAGFQVVVLEKGPWFKTGDFTKDEIVAVRREVYVPNLMDEPQVLETKNKEGEWIAKSNYKTGKSFWNGNVVGGSSNFMSGYFHRLKPRDFKLLSTYGPIKGANIVDWPIAYDDLEPYYDKVEKVVGVSGKVVDHSAQEPRSSADFPQPPLAENIVSSWLDEAADKLGYKMVPIPRAILSRPKEGRNSCYYSNFCGSYGCGSDAKGSSRIALLNEGLKTDNLTIIPYAKVFHLDTDSGGSVVKARYHDDSGKKQSVTARIFVVAAQAIETSRLLLMSKSELFPNGLANNSGQVGKNLIFSAGGIGGGHFYFDELPAEKASQLKMPGVFVNRSLHHWYEIDDPQFGKTVKGGMVDFLFEHANATARAIRQKWDEDGNLVYGSALKKKLKDYFTKQRRLKFEVFADWLPNDNCHVTLDPEVKDKWGDPVARIRLGYHDHDLKVGEYLAKKAEALLEEMGAKEIRWSISGGAPPNLQAGGCRFGTDPSNSVLNADCRAHEVENLYVTDGSFMPTGGSVTYTWTIYANAFRVADKILAQLNA